MGTPLAAVPTLENLLKDGEHEVVAVWTQPDRPKGRGNNLAMPPVKEFALENNLEVFQPTKIKTAESLELFKSHNADVAVVVAYGRILPETFLTAFPKGAINVHFFASAEISRSRAGQLGNCQRRNENRHYDDENGCWIGHRRHSFAVGNGD